jgi:hypothetical protein
MTMATATSLSRSPRIQALMDRIRGLVAEERRLERTGRRDLAGALRLEISLLQEQLAGMVIQELGRARA